MPALTGTVTLQAQSSASIDGDPIFVLATWEPPESFPGEAYTFPDPELNGLARGVPVFPAPGCRAGRHCTGKLTLGVGLLANDLERLEGVGITVSWRVEVRLQYPPGSQPPAGAALRLTDVLP